MTHPVSSRKRVACTVQGEQYALFCAGEQYALYCAGGLCALHCLRRRKVWRGVPCPDRQQEGPCFGSMCCKPCGYHLEIRRHKAVNKALAGHHSISFLPSTSRMTSDSDVGGCDRARDALCLTAMGCNGDRNLLGPHSAMFHLLAKHQSKQTIVMGSCGGL